MPLTTSVAATAGVALINAIAPIITQEPPLNTEAPLAAAFTANTGGSNFTMSLELGRPEWHHLRRLFNDWRNQGTINENHVVNFTSFVGQQVQIIMPATFLNALFVQVNNSFTGATVLTAAGTFSQIIQN